MTSNAIIESIATQPILCCVGIRVAGKPTQFLMERAIASRELDWRALTVEIRHEDLATVLAGMHAMRFVAVRFFPSLQEAALVQISQASQLASFVGSITSARWTTAGWEVWHNWGLAIHRWAAESTTLSQTLCWLHGDSVHSRSMLSALHDRAQQPGALPKSVVWTAPPPAIPPELLKVGEGEQALQVHCVASEETLQGSSSMEAAAECIKSLIVNEGIRAALIVGDSLPAEIQRQVCEEMPVWVAGARATVDSFSTLGSEQITLLDDLNQIIACETYDFERWTGQRIDFHVLRDAYDEYYSFLMPSLAGNAPQDPT